jgi:deoxyxylulose-5-phosphate synthase
MSMLDATHSPADFKASPADQFSTLDDEIRQRIISVMNTNGCHIGLNLLGVVVLTIALAFR